MKKITFRLNTSAIILGKNRSGASAVEFALIMPVFVLLLVGLMNFGYSVYALNIIQNTAMETARAYTHESLSKDEAEAFILDQTRKFGDTFSVDIDEIANNTLEITITGDAEDLELFFFPLGSPSFFSETFSVSYRTPTYDI